MWTSLLAASLLLVAQETYVPPSVSSVVAPAVSPRALNGGQVVLEGVVDAGGGVREVRVVLGAEPFLDPAVSAAGQWRFVPAEREGEAIESRISLMMLFRPRTIFSAGSPVAIPAAAGPERAPFAEELSDPGYPVRSTAEGLVILELQIGVSGTIDALRIVQGAPVLAATAEQAVRGWTFSPAAVEGQAVPGTAIVAVSFLRPVIGPSIAPSR